MLLQFFNELSSNLVLKVKIESLFISMARKLIFFIIYYKQDCFDLDFGHLLATPLLKVGLRWQQLRSLMTKKYTKQCLIA